MHLLRFHQQTDTIDCRFSKIHNYNNTLNHSTKELLIALLEWLKSKDFSLFGEEIWVRPSGSFRNLNLLPTFFSILTNYFHQKVIMWIFRYFPSRAWCLSVFNYCKQYSDNSLLQNMIVGAFAGSTEAVIFYPLTFTRTRLGVDVGRGKEDRQFTNTLDCFKKIIKNDGFKGLYRGLWVSLVLISLTKSTYFGFYESAKRNLDCYRDKSYHLVLIWMLAILSILVLVI